MAQQALGVSPPNVTRVLHQAASPPCFTTLRRVLHQGTAEASPPCAPFSLQQSLQQSLTRIRHAHPSRASLARIPHAHRRTRQFPRAPCEGHQRTSAMPHVHYFHCRTCTTFIAARALLSLRTAPCEGHQCKFVLLCHEYSVPEQRRTCTDAILSASPS